jgi:RNA polymerase sigma-70 factor (ECF subfamily)
MASEFDNIIKGCILGNRLSQYALYKKISPYLMTVCTRYTFSRFEAEDCLQESFVKIFASINKYSGSGSFEGWARRITINTILDYLRKTKKVKFNEDVEDAAELEQEKESNSMEYNELIHIISQLPKNLKIVFNMYAVEGYSHKEIGEKLGITDSASRTYLTRAKEKLVELHKQHNYVSEQQIS